MLQGKMTGRNSLCTCTLNLSLGVLPNGTLSLLSRDMLSHAYLRIGKVKTPLKFWQLKIYFPTHNIYSDPNLNNYKALINT